MHYGVVVTQSDSKEQSDSAITSDVDWRKHVDRLVAELRPQVGPLPYDPTPERLYNASELYRSADSDGNPDGSEIVSFSATIDQAIYRRARKAGDPPIDPAEALAQRLHDHGITVALDRFRSTRSLVGVMGGHALARGSDGYLQAVQLGRAATLAGHCVVTGGGPGAMEAANFGAATAGHDQAKVDEFLAELASSPDFRSDQDSFIRASLGVASKLEDPVENLSVPTWFYGHEPSNPFATHIAKYFSNSEREDGLLAIALAGIVFLAGGPGTMQEVFQDAAQNAYKTFGRVSPMVFLAPPHKPDYWQRSGIMAALDHTFTSYDGSRRPGWDLLTGVQAVDEAVARLHSSENSQG